jgi:hypothetical protein
MSVGVTTDQKQKQTISANFLLFVVLKMEWCKLIRLAILERKV